MILRIIGQKDDFTSNEEGTFDFEIEMKEDDSKTALLYFPDNTTDASRILHLQSITSDTILVIDRQQDILSYRQNNTAFTIQGQVKDQSGKPIAKASVSIQGTGRRTQTDASGRFSIAADYNHPIVIRANGMMNQTLNIREFLSNPDIEKNIYMQPQNTYQVYTTVEKMPEFPGGMKAFQQYVQKNLPQQDVKEKGVVIIQFIVEKNGNISNPTIARGFKAEMDTLALNLVSNMPKWIPGEEDNGNKVRCKYSVPIQFKPKEIPTAKTTVPAKPAVKPTKTIQDTLAVDTLAQEKPIGTIQPISADSLSTSANKATETKEKQIPTDSLSASPAEEPVRSTDSISIDSITISPTEQIEKKQETTDSIVKTDTIPSIQKVSK